MKSFCEASCPTLCVDRVLSPTHRLCYVILLTTSFLMYLCRKLCLFPAARCRRIHKILTVWRGLRKRSSRLIRTLDKYRPQFPAVINRYSILLSLCNYSYLLRWPHFSKSEVLNRIIARAQARLAEERCRNDYLLLLPAHIKSERDAPATPPGKL
jgi:hypothetical protein